MQALRVWGLWITGSNFGGFGVGGFKERRRVQGYGLQGVKAAGL